MSAVHGPEMLRRLRRERGLSQQQLADFAAISVRTIRSLERRDGHTPRRSSLQAVADALRLDAPTSETLLRGWQERGAIASLDDLTERRDVMAFLREAQVRVAGELQTVSFSRLTTVGSTRRIAQEEDTVVVRAKVDGARRMLCVATSNESQEVADLILDRLRGCRLAARHLAADRGLVAFELEFPAPLAQGESHLVGYRVSVDPRYTERASTGRELGRSSGVACGSRSSIGRLHVQACFERAPSSVHRIEGDGSGRAPEPTALLRLRADNCVVVERENVHGGVYGLQWDWD